MPLKGLASAEQDVDCKSDQLENRDVGREANLNRRRHAGTESGRNRPVISIMLSDIGALAAQVAYKPDLANMTNLLRTNKKNKLLLGSAEG
jgi:hypothetical protein